MIVVMYRGDSQNLDIEGTCFYGSDDNGQLHISHHMFYERKLPFGMLYIRCVVCGFRQFWLRKKDYYLKRRQGPGNVGMTDGEE